MQSLQHHCPSLSANLVASQDSKSGIAFFRGIPYASVSKRWTQSTIQDSLPSPFDATDFGPRCPQPAHVSTIPAVLKRPDVQEDEFKCLNLNITVPVDALPKLGHGEKQPLLPVMVWVHGYVKSTYIKFILSQNSSAPEELRFHRGAFKNGSNSDPLYYPLAFSTIASENGNPVVLVQISYRLGIFGFAVSSDLLSEHPSTSSTPFANFGLHDQRTAFAWVQSHISDFGGDPQNVTAFGVSAGSASLHMHVLSGQPLFDRAILMSGCGPTMGPYPLPFFERGWVKVCKDAGVSDLETPEMRLTKLRTLPTVDLAKLVTRSHICGPLGEDDFLPTSWKVGGPHPSTRCQEIIIGNTVVEGIIFDARSTNIPQSAFRAKLLTVFPKAEDNIRFCELFGFVAEEMSPEDFRDALRRFISTVMFHYPSLRVAESFSSSSAADEQARKAYSYRFNTPSPYPGPSHGLSVHGQCATFLFNNDFDAWPTNVQIVTKEMARIWAGFAYGHKPWEEFNASEEKVEADNEGRVMVFGNGEFGVKGLDDGEADGWGREDGTTGWLREHFDKATRLVMALLG